MNKITPLLKGAITGCLMLAITLSFYYTKQPENYTLPIIIFGIYAAGIAWTLLAYYRSTEYTAKFGDIFAKGFRYFIIVILIMVLFIIVFNFLHPEIAEESAALYKADMVSKNDPSPDEIERRVAAFKKQYTVQLIYPVIFGYLIVGSILTSVGAGLLLIRRK